MRIELDKLAELGGRFAGKVDSLSSDDGEIRLLGPAEVQGRIERAGKEVELRGELHATVEIRCSRCLKPVTVPLDGEFDERFASEVGWRGEEQHELRPEDLNLAVFDGEAIELDDFVREHILLALPGHVLCREDCKGLCPECGADLNAGACKCESKEIDSRWQALKDLRS